MTTTHDWRGRALATWAEKQRENDAWEAQRQAEQQARDAARLKKLLAVVGIEAEPTSGMIDIDGVWFGARRDEGLYYLHICQPCQRCGGYRCSRPITSPAGLGYALSNPDDTMYHECDPFEEVGVDAPPTKQPTVEQQFIESLRTDEAMQDLQTTNQELYRTAMIRNAANATIQQAKANIESQRALLLISGEIDGKNAEIREAQLVQRLAADPEYQRLRAALDVTTVEAAEADARLEHLRNQATAIKIKLRLAAAQLEFLAGERS